MNKAEIQKKCKVRKNTSGRWEAYYDYPDGYRWTYVCHNEANTRVIAKKHLERLVELIINEGPVHGLK